MGKDVESARAVVINNDIVMQKMEQNMTWKISETCSRCGAQYEIDVLDLRHENSDSITCVCCGETIKEWRNEARSFSIARQMFSGSIDPKYKDIDKYIGQILRFSKGETSFEGIVVGLGDSVMAISPTEVIRPWVIRTNKKDIHINPEDGWIVCCGKNLL